MGKPRRFLFATALGAMLAAASCSTKTTGFSGSSASGTGGGTATATGTGATSTTSVTSGGMCNGMDSQCPAGTVCLNGSCIPGCDASHGCDGSKTCCSGQCFDLSSDINNCGMCGMACPQPFGATATCNGTCQFACATGHYNCSGNLADGCKSTAPCTCMPGSTQTCYDGPMGTSGVGICKSGTRTCNITGDGYGPCLGEVLPEQETNCTDGLDHNCDGTPNNPPDLDGDGWTICNGDCDDTNPLVNPGAYEIVGDGIDNDCNPATPDTAGPPPCISTATFSNVTGLNMAAAMDICNYSGGVQTTTANAPLPQKIWGVISATQLLANGTAPAPADLSNIQNGQDAVVQDFGNTIVPKKGPTMGVISSGKARDSNDPGWVQPIGGTAYNTAIAFSPNPGGPLGTYLAAHGGNLLPGQCGAMTCPVGTGANDSTDVRLVIRVPTNAKSFAYDFRFFSAEYQTYQCTMFNDYYLAMLTSTAMGIPADHQISFDANNNAVSVNNGFFQDCGGNGKGCGTCPFGTAALAGTGFDTVNGGATEWLTTQAPITPGETMTLDLMVFDVGDHIFDTLVLLDNFRWSPQTSTVNTHT